MRAPGMGAQPPARRAAACWPLGCAIGHACVPTVNHARARPVMPAAAVITRSGSATAVLLVPSRRPGASPSARPPPAKSPSGSPAPSLGTLAALPAVLRLSQPALGVAYSGTFTLTVPGGLVRGFQVTGPALAGDLLISPLAGSLASGQRGSW